MPSINIDEQIVKFIMENHITTLFMIGIKTVALVAPPTFFGLFILLLYLIGKKHIGEKKSKK